MNLTLSEWSVIITALVIVGLLAFISFYPSDGFNGMGASIFSILVVVFLGLNALAWNVTIKDVKKRHEIIRANP